MRCHLRTASTNNQDTAIYKASRYADIISEFTPDVNEVKRDILTDMKPKPNTNFAAFRSPAKMLAAPRLQFAMQTVTKQDKER